MYYTIIKFFNYYLSSCLEYKPQEIWGQLLELFAASSELGLAPGTQEVLMGNCGMHGQLPGADVPVNSEPRCLIRLHK